VRRAAGRRVAPRSERARQARWGASSGRAGGENVPRSKPSRLLGRCARGKGGAAAAAHAPPQRRATRAPTRPWLSGLLLARAHRLRARSARPTSLPATSPRRWGATSGRAGGKTSHGRNPHAFSDDSRAERAAPPPRPTPLPNAGPRAHPQENGCPGSSSHAPTAYERGALVPPPGQPPRRGGGARPPGAQAGQTSHGRNPHAFSDDPRARGAAPPPRPTPSSTPGHARTHTRIGDPGPSSHAPSAYERGALVPPRGQPVRSSGAAIEVGRDLRARRRGKRPTAETLSPSPAIRAREERRRRGPRPSSTPVHARTHTRIGDPGSSSHAPSAYERGALVPPHCQPPRRGGGARPPGAQAEKMSHGRNRHASSDDARAERAAPPPRPTPHSYSSSSSSSIPPILLRLSPLRCRRRCGRSGLDWGAGCRYARGGGARFWHPSRVRS
jgi:hypothetical protein